jgi:hypothetical protein
MGGRGREGELIEWTGSVCLLKWVTEANPGGIIHDRDTEREQSRGSRPAPTPPRKASRQIALRPYRKPTQVGQEKTLQVNERPSVKELGKLTPYLWKKGGLSTLWSLDHGGGGGTESAQPTVYQKHRSLPTRKRMYRG